MTRRTIASTGRLASREIRDVVQAALIAEILHPSRRLWLASAWITDAVVIDNAGGEFTTFIPEWPERGIRLSEAIAQIALTGTKVVVATNTDERNRLFTNALRDQVAGMGEVLLYELPELHRKRLVTERMMLMGSMNFTHFGLNRNAEDLVIDTAPESVADAINVVEGMIADRTPRP